MARQPTGKPRRSAGDGPDDQRRRIVDAALALAATEGWRDLGLARVAEAAGVSLAQLHAAFPCRGCILEAFIRRIDEQVLAAGPADAGDGARDRLFELLMRRFDALAPNKAAVAAILRDIAEPAVGVVGLPALARSMAWTFEAAGIPVAGLAGLLRIQGLALIYANAVRVWLRDDTADLAKTMAALDKGLRRAEWLVDLLAGRRRDPVDGAKAAG
jgi:AcrR family transcriptional regulator